MSLPDNFKIGIVQHPCWPDHEKNISAAVSGLRQAAKQGAQVICLQELLDPYIFAPARTMKIFDLAETLDGPTVSGMQQEAKQLGVVLVVPFFERRTAGIYHNSAAVIDADGSLVGVYRKMHIPDDPLYYEKFYFTPGDSTGEKGGFRVFKTKYATIGVLICWDQWYPEGSRITALMGAEVIFYPTAIGWHPSEKSWFGEKQAAAWRTVQTAHAIANGVYVAAPNRIGHEEALGSAGIEFFGRSFIADPFGEILAESKSTSAEILTVDCSRKTLEETRRNWPFLRDRRIDAYAPLLARYID